MKCLYCSSEVFPYICTGGLAEVAGSLPIFLTENGVETSVILPLYGNIKKEDLEFITSFKVPVSWREKYCGVFKAKRSGIIYYFLDNEYYFKREKLYGYFDDAERFSFFSRAILEMLKYINLQPQILHANDWQTALVPVYFSLYYSSISYYKDIKTVFSIHNIEYQGDFLLDTIKEVIGLPEKDFSLLEFNGRTNFIKGAIECANRITTVSPNYAHEILNPWFSFGLEPILKDNNWKLSGILNGINTSVYNPENDPDIYFNYSFRTFEENKKKNKIELQKRLNLETKINVPLITMIGRLVKNKGIDLIKEAFEELLKKDIQFVILGSGEKDYEDYFRIIQERYKGRVCACFGFVPELSKKLYAASDIFLMPSRQEPCGLAQMVALRYGSVPVVREIGGLVDTIKDFGGKNGNGVVFKNYDYKDMLFAIERAIDLFYKKDEMNKLIKRGMLCENSWKKSAQKYIELYRSM